VILWAGGGVNNATKYYSAYTVSKIAQIKITELLNHELKNVSFTILGPGWVKTKIHKQTLNNPKNARENFIRTKKRYKSNNFVPIKKVTDCVLKVLASKNKFFDGRNISVENDLWMNDSFLEILSEDENIYKLRRDFNDFKFSDLQFNIIDILDLLLKNRNFQKPNSLIYKTFKRILHMRFVLEQRRNKIGHTIKADDISKIINLYTKKNKNKKIINSCLDSKSIKLKKLLSILK
jgi:hypothetical protein